MAFPSYGSDIIAGQLYPSAPYSGVYGPRRSGAPAILGGGNAFADAALPPADAGMTAGNSASTVVGSGSGNGADINGSMLIANAAGHPFNLMQSPVVWMVAALGLSLLALRFIHWA